MQFLTRTFPDYTSRALQSARIAAQYWPGEKDAYQHSDYQNAILTILKNCDANIIDISPQDKKDLADQYSREIQAANSKEALNSLEGKIETDSTINKKRNPIYDWIMGKERTATHNQLVSEIQWRQLALNHQPSIALAMRRSGGKSHFCA